MAKVFSAVVVGVTLHPVEVEARVGAGFSGLTLLGLPSEAARDTRERVRAALEAVGIQIPARRIVVNVSPLESVRLMRSPAQLLDFAVAVAIIKALSEAADEGLEKAESSAQNIDEFFIGELCLGGELRPLKSRSLYNEILESAPGRRLHLPECGQTREHGNLHFHASLLDWYLERHEVHPFDEAKMIEDTQKGDNEGVANVQEMLERMRLLLKTPTVLVSILVAAAGRHHLLLAGEPGIGKSFAVQSMPYFLPPLSKRESRELQLIYETEDGMRERPFRAPHHSASMAAIVGGASLKPGEVTLAHSGLLFLDELAEFSRATLEALREPVDSGSVALSRSGGVVKYPANFQLCGATNPCPCGFLLSRRRPCRCQASERRKYLQKLSGPLLDRFCMQVFVDARVDMISSFLMRELDEGRGENFCHHFYAVQRERFNLVDEPVSESVLELLSDVPNFAQLSLRSRLKLGRLYQTFSALFCEIAAERDFLAAVCGYRSLDKMLERVLN